MTKSKAKSSASAAPIQLPPPVEPGTGIALDGAEAKWPHNHRLRAEAMAREGIDTDPDGLITDELIAETGERLARDDAAADAAEKEAEAEAKRAESEQADAVAQAQRDEEAQRLAAEQRAEQLATEGNNQGAANAGGANSEGA